LRSNTKVYGGKTHYTDSQNSDTTAPNGRELHHLQFSLQVASPGTFGYTLVCFCFIFAFTLSSKSDEIHLTLFCNDEAQQILQLTVFIHHFFQVSTRLVQCHDLPAALFTAFVRNREVLGSNHGRKTRQSLPSVPWAHSARLNLTRKTPGYRVIGYPD
jgi:hypothetical protein